MSVCLSVCMLSAHRSTLLTFATKQRHLVGIENSCISRICAGSPCMSFKSILRYLIHKFLDSYFCCKFNLVTLCTLSFYYNAIAI